MNGLIVLRLNGYVWIKIATTKDSDATTKATEALKSAEAVGKFPPSLLVVKTAYVLKWAEYSIHGEALKQLRFC